MTKTTWNNEITCVMGLSSSILSVTLNHRTNIITVEYAHETERVDPADDWVWWDHLAAKYFS